MAHSTSDINLDELKPLSQAEQGLIACCKAGEWLFLEDTVPDQPSDENSIRGPLIRHLLLGGCEDAPAHAKGVQVYGGYITEVLDFEYGDTDQALLLAYCKVAEDLDFTDCHIRSIFLTGSEVAGLHAQRAKIERNIFMDTKFHAKGPVNLGGAEIDGQLACDGGQFDQGLNGNALVVKADVFLRYGFHAKVPVDLGGTKIGGQLDCSGGQFDQGLNGNALVVKADVFLRNGFHAKGPVDLRGAKIGGQLSCIGGQFDQGLDGDTLVVKANVFLRNGFHAKGPVILRGAEIGGQLSCIDGQFDQGLDGNALVVKTSVFLSDGFHAKGSVNLGGAEIGGQLSCVGGQFDSEVTFSGMTVGSTFSWRDIKGKFTSVVLDGAYVGTLEDDMESWFNGADLLLGGFTYDNLSGRVSVADWLDWLAQNFILDVALADQVSGDFKQVLGKEFAPQPYTQLAGILNKMGHARGAANILAKRDQLQKRSEWARERLPKPTHTWVDRRALVADFKRPIDWLFGAVFGYGHLPSRAVFAALGIIAFAIVFYGAVYSAGQMAPNSDVILTSLDWRAIADVAGHQNPAQIWSDSLAGRDYESFSAIGYGIDLFIPLDALGQENAWAPSKERGDWGWWGFHLRWVIQILGWVITAVLAATLTGLIGRK